MGCDVCAGSCLHQVREAHYQGDERGDPPPNSSVKLCLVKVKACQLLHKHTHTHTHTHTSYTHTHMLGEGIWWVCACVQETWVQSWVGRSPGGGHGNPLQYSCLENSMRKGAWRGHKEPDVTQQLTLSFRPSELSPHLQDVSLQWLLSPKSLQTFCSYNAVGLWLLKLS